LSGWIPPSDICEDEYNLFKYDEPSALRGFVGFGASFGGKWFGGYARGYNYFRMRDYMEETSRAIVADIRRLKETDAEISFECHSYEAVSANSRYVIYCDPPYEDTLGYAGTPKFNHAQFWQWAHKQHENGALVIVSGYKAPDDWTCIAEFTHKVNVSYQHNNRRSTVERLFTPT
jgi:DNA adenine methylase